MFVVRCLYGSFYPSLMKHILFAHGAYFMNKYGSLDMFIAHEAWRSHIIVQEEFISRTHSMELADYALRIFQSYSIGSSCIPL